MGSSSFVENVKALLAFRAKGRDVIGGMKGVRSGRDLLPISFFLGPDPGERIIKDLPWPDPGETGSVSLSKDSQ